MIKDKLNGILDKIEDNADGIGGLLGIMSDPMANGRGLSMQTFEFMIDRISKWNIPNPIQVFHSIMAFPEAYPVMNNIMAGLGGWALAEFGSIVDPRVAKLGRIVKKGAFSAAIGNIIGGFVWLPGHLAEPATSTSNSIAQGQYSV